MILSKKDKELLVIKLLNEGLRWAFYILVLKYEMLQIYLYNIMWQQEITCLSSDHPLVIQ